MDPDAAITTPGRSSEDAGTGALALALSGGGARAAYQVGALRSLAKRRPHLRASVLTGVSAGAINAVALANHRGTFGEAVERLRSLWLAIETARVFRTDPFSLGAMVLRWVSSLASARARLAPRPQGLVDTRPLREFLAEALGSGDAHLEGIERNLRDGRLQALAITTTHYGTGRSISWVQGSGFEPWRRPRRESVPCLIGLDHVMASAALPMLFPAIRIGREWHGDGGIRQIAPLSPALHLGATHILTVSTRAAPSRPEAAPGEEEAHPYPSPAQIAGVLLDAVFLDMLDFDLLNLDRISSLLAGLPPEQRASLRPVRAFVLRPSRDLAELAAEHEWRLPRTVRFLLRGIGTDERRSAGLLSMVLFEPEFIRRLLELGESDADAGAEALDEFLDG